MKYPIFSLILLTFLASTRTFAQNTLQGEAKIVPEKEVNRQSQFIEAEQARLLDHYDEAIKKYEDFLYYNEEVTAAWYGLAKAHYANGNPVGAMDALSKGLQKEPGNRWLLIFQADLFEEDGKNAEAAGVYEKLIGYFPGEPGFYQQLAYLQVLAGNPKDGLKTLDKLESLTGISEETSTKKHMVYLAMGDKKKAVAELEKLINAFPNRTAYRHKLALYYESIGDAENARKIHQDILAVDPDDPVSQLAVVAKSTRSDDASFLSSLQPLFADPGVSLDAKIEELMPFLRNLKPGADPAVEAALADLGARIETAHKLDPKAWSLSGDIFYLLGNHPEALQRYRKCISLNPTVFTVWANTMDIIDQDGNYAELAKTAEQAMDDFPNQPLAYYYYGKAQNRRKNWNDALPQLEQALIMTGKNPEVQRDLLAEIGISLCGLKKADQAIQRLQKAVAEGGGKHAALLESLGDAYFLSGEKAKARENWEKSNAIAPNPSLEQKIQNNKL